MSDSPIFDQLVSSYGASMKFYDDFAHFQVPDFVWDPEREVVPLDKPRGVRIGKRHTIAKGFQAELPESVTKPSLIEVWKPHPEALEEAKFITGMFDDLKAEAASKFSELYPDAVITRVVGIKGSLDEGTLSLVVEGLHPTVKPLSERNPAQPME